MVGGEEMSIYRLQKNIILSNIYREMHSLKRRTEAGEERIKDMVKTVEI